MSVAMSGKSNPMYGKNVYQIWVDKYGVEEADRRKAETFAKRSLSLSGSGNPMYGKPAPNGSGNGWSGWYCSIRHGRVFFRSLRELAFMVRCDEASISWQPAEHIKISYVSWNGAKRTYHPDFLVSEVVIEIKPQRLFKSENVMLKKVAAKRYCQEHGMTYLLIDVPPLAGGEIDRLYETKRISFIERYQRLYNTGKLDDSSN